MCRRSSWTMSHSSRSFDRWRSHRGERGSSRADTVPFDLGLDRTAEGRRAVASEPSLEVLDMRATPHHRPASASWRRRQLYSTLNALSVCQVALNNGGTIVLLPSFTAHRLHRCRVALSGAGADRRRDHGRDVLRERDAMAAADFSAAQSLRIGGAQCRQLVGQIGRRCPWMFEFCMATARPRPAQWRSHRKGVCRCRWHRASRSRSAADPAMAPR